MSNHQDKPIYLSLPQAMSILEERLLATREELGAWLFYKRHGGGITGYTNVNEIDPPPEFQYGYYSGQVDYLTPQNSCQFISNDIENFQPTTASRYITGKALIERWSSVSHIDPRAYILARISESRLPDFHPTFGFTQAAQPDWKWLPTFEDGLFRLSDIEAIEAEDGICAPVNKSASPMVTTARVTNNKLRRNTLDPAIDKAIKQAGNTELADVYLKLKALALAEENPFTGVIECDALCYTNGNNNAAKLTKNALGKRLKNRQ